MSAGGRSNDVLKNGSSESSKYPSWKDGQPNLQTYLNAINLSNPIVQSQFELVWSRWPRTKFFAKNVTIPGVEVNTIDVSHAGFTIPIPTHVTYGTNEISISLVADKEGYHYYDIRNMVLQTAHPLVAGDTKAMIGSFENISDEDILEVRLRNCPEDQTHHHWIIHNFHPIKIGDIELSHDSSGFVEFELTGTFTHIDYDCGHNTPATSPFESQQQEEPSSDGAQGDEEPSDGDVESEYPPDYEEPDVDEGNPDEEEGESDEDEDYDGEYEGDEGDESEGDEGGGDEGDGGDEEEAATLDDQDERDAYDMVKEHGADDPNLKQKMMDKLQSENPDEDPEIIEARADLAVDAAKKYAAQHPSDEVGGGGSEQPSQQRRIGIIRRVIVFKNKSGFIPSDQTFLQTDVLSRAIRFNRLVRTKKQFKIDVDVDAEMNSYGERITQLTLPHRFGMYKTQFNMPRKTKVELETPSEAEVEDSTVVREDGTIHRVRGIF